MKHRSDLTVDARALARERTQQPSWTLLMTVGLLVVGLALGVAVRPAAAADQKVTVYVNGCIKEWAPPAIQRNGTTYVPLRQGVEAVAGKLKWDAVNSRAIITAGRRTAVVSKSQGVLVDGSLFIPLRMVAEALGVQVSYNGEARVVDLTTRANVPVPT